MTQRHFYLGVINLNLNATQRGLLIDALKALGPASNKQPARLNHWRVRLDDEAIILEAAFNEENLTVASFKTRLAALFGVDAGDIGHSTGGQSYAGGITNVVTFSYNAVDRIRFALFGGAAATWADSGNECRGYLKLYSDEWEPEEEL